MRCLLLLHSREALAALLPQLYWVALSDCNFKEYSNQINKKRKNNGQNDRPSESQRLSRLGRLRGKRIENQ